jgi:hypothetical protein
MRRQTKHVSSLQLAGALLKVQEQHNLFKIFKTHPTVSACYNKPLISTGMQVYTEAEETGQQTAVRRHHAAVFACFAA